MQLRSWQKECVDLASVKFTAGQKTFLCVASPGAGKTLFSATLAKQLLERKIVDYVVCIAPTRNVVNSILKTFTKVTNQSFDGLLGARGSVLTYQALPSQFERLKSLAENYRILFVTDEIHHCAYSFEGQSNTWGQQLQLLAKGENSRCLMLSGTPWRSDSSQLALANYAGEPLTIQPDYIYGLKQAVEDNACRRPRVCLLDHSSITIGSNHERKHFNNIAHAIKARELKYSQLLHNHESAKCLLLSAREKLHTILATHPDAGGLVVASSIEHAKQMQSIIELDWQESAILVTSEDIQAQRKIDEFRTGPTLWLISVGMVAEGTDIPRLHVCAYMSTVRTELYFRQVLGRIIRVNKLANEPCFLVCFAEPSLKEFSARLAVDLPAECTVIPELIDQPTEFSIEASDGLTESQREAYDLVEQSLGNTAAQPASTLALGHVTLMFGADPFREQIISI